MSAYNSSDISAIKVAQVVGLTSSAFLAGTITTYSLAFIPVLRKAAPSAPKAAQWADAYWIGASTAPPMAVVSGCSLGYLAYRALSASSSALPEGLAPQPTAAGYFYLAAAVLATGFVPFTLVVMKPVNDRLHAKAKKQQQQQPGTSSGSAGGKEPAGTTATNVFTQEDHRETDALLVKWRALNYVRALFPATAALLATWAALSWSVVDGRDFVAAGRPVMETAHSLII